MKSRLFLKVAWRYLTRHPWQSCLMVLGITLGVAVAVAVDLANTSASRAFDLSTQAVAGKATHYITGGPGGLDEALYAKLAKSGRNLVMTPVLSEYVSSVQLGGGLFQLLGIDVFSDGPFRVYFQGDGRKALPLADLTAFLTRPGAVFLSSDVAQRNGLKAGDALELEITGHAQKAFVAGLIQPADDLSRRALNNLLLADLATVQELTGKLGKLERIELIVDEKDAEGVLNDLKANLPVGVYILPAEARTGTLAEMAAAFRLNLSALSLLALVVGLFLIYNTMTFSVVQRRPLFGNLRALGVTRMEIFWLVEIEAALAGSLGALLGCLAGVLMGQTAVRLVTTTINDLFFVLNVQGVQIPMISLVKGAGLGFLATIFTAAPPAWEAASIPPRLAMSRSGLELKAQSAVTLVAFGGIAMSLIGGAILLLSQHHLLLSFLGTAVVVVGFAMLAPAGTVVLTRALTPLTGWLWGTLGRMAPRAVVKSLSRTAVAIAALMVAVSVTIGVSLMVSSFRYTVIAWLDQVLQGDIYISAPSLTESQTSAPLDTRLLKVLQANPGIREFFTLRAVSVDSAQGMVQINASSNPQVGKQRLYQALYVPEDRLAAEMVQGGVVLSEPLANRLDLGRRKRSLSLMTDRGLHEFPVVGIYYDYSSTLGVVLMLQDVYHQYWDDPMITAASLMLAPGEEADRLALELQKSLAPIQRLNVRPNRELKAEVLAVFDRTFAITRALQILATGVAFIGVLSALLSLELERQRELGILRAIGMTASQLWGLVMLETGLLGVVSGLLAMPTGLVLAEILVYVINKRSFGWTLQMNLQPAPFIGALLLAIAAALLAGIYPAYRMSRMQAAEAMRYE